MDCQTGLPGWVAIGRTLTFPTGVVSDTAVRVSPTCDASASQGPSPPDVRFAHWGDQTPFGDPAAQTGATSPTLGFQADFHGSGV